MSEQKIILNLGGRYDFRVEKTVAESGVERFQVSSGELHYGGGRLIAGPAAWAEAMDAMNVFRAEAADAAEALVQISTLTASGAHEENE